MKLLKCSLRVRQHCVLLQVRQHCLDVALIVCILILCSTMPVNAFTVSKAVEIPPAPSGRWQEYVTVYNVPESERYDNGLDFWQVKTHLYLYFRTVQKLAYEQKIVINRYTRKIADNDMMDFITFNKTLWGIVRVYRTPDVTGNSRTFLISVHCPSNDESLKLWL